MKAIFRKRGRLASSLCTTRIGGLQQLIPKLGIKYINNICTSLRDSQQLSELLNIQKYNSSTKKWAHSEQKVEENWETAIRSGTELVVQH